MEENLIIKTSKLIWHIDLVPSIRNWSFIQCSTSKLTRWRREYSATFWLLFHSIIRRCVLYFYFLINHIHGGTHTHTCAHSPSINTKKKKKTSHFLTFFTDFLCQKENNRLRENMFLFVTEHSQQITAHSGRVKKKHGWFFFSYNYFHISSFLYFHIGKSIFPFPLRKGSADNGLQSVKKIQKAMPVFFFVSSQRFHSVSNSH